MLKIIFALLFAASAQAQIYPAEASPFDKNCDCPCGRDWLMPEAEMDDLKLKIAQLDAIISATPENTNPSILDNYEKIYAAEFVVRTEFNGKINKQFCAHPEYARLAETPDAKYDYRGPYLRKISIHRYIGNANIDTYIVEYFAIKN